MLKKQENLHFFNFFIQQTWKGAGFLAFLILKSPECCVLQCKINFFMKSFIFFFFCLRNSLQLGPPPPYSHLIALMMGRAWVHVPYWLPNLPELWLQQIKALLSIALHLSCENTASCALSSFHKLRAHSHVLWYIYIYIYIYTLYHNII